MLKLFIILVCSLTIGLGNGKSQTHLDTPVSALSCDSLIRMGVQAMFSEKYSKSLEILTTAKVQAQREIDYQCLFLSLNNIGLDYYKLFDYTEALNYYSKAYSIAVEHLQRNDEMIVLNNIAILYSKNSDHAKSKSYFLRAYRISKDYDDLRRTARYALNLGLVFNKLNESTRAKHFFEIAKSLNQKNDLLSLKISLGIAENKLLDNKPLVSISVIKSILKRVQEIGDRQELISANYLLAKAYQRLGNTENAIRYAHKALNRSQDPRTKKETLGLLAKLYYSQGQFNTVIALKDSLLHTINQLHSIRQTQLMATAKTKFELQTYKNEIKTKSQKLSYERKIYFIIIIAFVCFVLLLLWGWRNSIVKNRQRKSIALREKEMIELELKEKRSSHLLLEKQMQKQEVETALEEERLKREIEQRNRELTVKTLEHSNRNELLRQIISTLSTQEDVKLNSNLRNAIKQLQQYLKDDKLFKEFFTHFEAVNPTFVKTLKQRFPKLNSNDIRFLCYLYMNLSTKEIAVLFNITTAACRKRKERIAAKLNLPNASKIHDFIFTIQ